MEVVVDENGKNKVTLPQMVTLNDQLYTAAVPDSQKNATLWKVIMGYPYANNSDTYDGRTTKENYKDPITKSTIYWNLVPITTQSIAGYATTYCYFDRVGVGDGVMTIPQADMTGANSFHGSNATPWDKGNTIQERYRKFLNDPQLKYNEVW